MVGELGEGHARDGLPVLLLEQHLFIQVSGNSDIAIEAASIFSQCVTFASGIELLVRVQYGAVVLYEL